MNRGRLRLVLLLFFLALAIPTGVLVMHAYGQLKWEAFHQYRQLAENMSRSINQRLTRLLAVEEARSFADYQFLVVEGQANFVQRSALSALPIKSDIPGLIGWFQVDTKGQFSTPLLPPPGIRAERYGIEQTGRAQRSALAARLHSILSANRLLDRRDATPRERRRTAPEEAQSTPLAEAMDRTVNAPQALEEKSSHDNDLPPAISSSRTAPARQAAQSMSGGQSGGARLRSKPAVAAPQAQEQSAQAAFDRLSKSKSDSTAARGKQALPGTLGRVDDLQLASPYANKAEEDEKRQIEAEQMRSEKSKKRAFRKEVAIASYAAPLKGEDANVAADAARANEPGTLFADRPTRILTFESELDPFEFSLLDSGHFVLYRNVWRDGQRYIQGALIEQQLFVASLVKTAFADTTLSRMSNLVVAWQGDVLATFPVGDTDDTSLGKRDELSGTLLYRARLSAPLADMELVFSVTRLPAGPGARVIAWTSAVLALVLIIGIWLMYRLAIRQFALARQQQDFVSAVSHELRTPITSIRMYAEMLQEGWASEEKKRAYYQYIVQESERLSRLIANVLQLARMTHNDFTVVLQNLSVAELMDGVQSKVTSQVQHAGFELHVDVDRAAASAMLHVDADAFSQCLINLVDNALKFSAHAKHKVVEVACHLNSDQYVNVTVRDYGPGVARDQMKKIFTLFYRAENELTRETVGTGIGLSLVHQLTRAMGGQVDVANADPGATFTLRFATRTVAG